MQESNTLQNNLYNRNDTMLNESNNVLQCITRVAGNIKYLKDR